ncbi:MAG TPA: type 1 glutamine amidotransferase [Candidatus Saccharimonadales bacterium]|nr:type 1 glutamine amidotransferase [Candidatus Saccharimonadales bacterium]
MGDLLIIKNVTREGPGLLEGMLAKHQVSFDVADLDQGEDFPNLVGYKALVVLGGSDSANDASAKMAKEREQIKYAIDNGLPYLGICLGMQVLVKAAGGRVVPGARLEAGFISPEKTPFQVQITPDGSQDPLLAGLDSPLPVFQLHGEVVELMPDMKLLGTAPVSPNQIVRVAPKAYGIQSHFELTDQLLQVWAAEDPDLQPIGYDALRTEFAKVKDAYTHTGETLFTNFLRLAGLIS